MYRRHLPVIMTEEMWLYKQMQDGLKPFHYQQHKNAGSYLVAHHQKCLLESLCQA